MFDSGISVKNLVEELKNEVDVALDIPNATYVTWLNSLQQLLYTEVIKEQNVVSYPFSGEGQGVLPTGENSGIRFEDIVALYVYGVQMIKSTPASGTIFPNTYYKKNNLTYFNTEPKPEGWQGDDLTIVFIEKPDQINVGSDDVIGEGNVMLPIEFIDLAKAKLRGEAYKLANEFDYAANWLNDYNILLEAFKVWIADKSPTFGM